MFKLRKFAPILIIAVAITGLLAFQSSAATISFSVSQANQDIVSEQNRLLISNAADAVNVDAVSVTATIITANEQATMLYGNYQTPEGVAKMQTLYGSKSDQTYAVYQASVAEGKSWTQIVADIEAVVPSLGFDHVLTTAQYADINVVDINTNSLADKKSAFITELTNRGATVKDFSAVNNTLTVSVVQVTPPAPPTPLTPEEAGLTLTNERVPTDASRDDLGRPYFENGAQAFVIRGTITSTKGPITYVKIYVTDASGIVVTSHEHTYSNPSSTVTLKHDGNTELAKEIDFDRYVLFENCGENQNNKYTIVVRNNAGETTIVESTFFVSTDKCNPNGQIYVTTASTYLRPWHGFTAVSTTVPKSKAITVTKSGDIWGHTNYNGKDGYVLMSSLRLADPTIRISGANTPPSNIQKGHSFGLTGVITCDIPITDVEVIVTQNGSYRTGVGMSAVPSVYSNKNSINIKTYYDARVVFNALANGTYEYAVRAKRAGSGETQTLLTSQFTVSASATTRPGGGAYSSSSKINITFGVKNAGTVNLSNSGIFNNSKNSLDLREINSLNSINRLNSFTDLRSSNSFSTFLSSNRPEDLVEFTGEIISNYDITDIEFMLIMPGFRQDVSTKPLALSKTLNVGKYVNIANLDLNTLRNQMRLLPTDTSLGGSTGVTSTIKIIVKDSMGAVYIAEYSIIKTRNRDGVKYEQPTLIKLTNSEPEKAFYPLPKLQLTQIGYESASHSKVNAIDAVGGDRLLAPFNGKIVYVRKDYTAALFQSANKVMYADGTFEYMTVLILHGDGGQYNQLLDWKNRGTLITQGTPFYNIGGAGKGGVKEYALHYDIQVYRGQLNSAAGNVGINQPNGDVCYAYDAFFISRSRTTLPSSPTAQAWGIKQSGNTMSNNSTPSYKDLWRIID